MRVIALAILAGGLLSACKRDASSASARSDKELLSEGTRYLDDPAFRREQLTLSLTNPANIYSKQRLSNYALGARGWDLLPEWNPKSVPLSKALAEDLRGGRTLRLEAEAPPLWDGRRPASMAEWAALGREVFRRYPLRAEPIVEWAVKHPNAAARAGVIADGEGNVPGVVAFVDVDGATRVGITCALCHTDVVDGVAVLGQARRTFDYGALRIAYTAESGAKVEGAVRRMHAWGPGRADVTEDDDEDPVAIPDLWALREQTFLTQAGTIRQRGPTALAIRQETQLLTSNHQKLRPPRELAFALTMALYAFTPPAVAPNISPETRRGKSLFDSHCVRCHSSGAGGGDCVPVNEVDTDHALANGAARGTGTYRIPTLVRVSRAAPYFHDGSVASLEDLLSPERLLPSFTRGFLGRGAVRGHRYGIELPRADRDALVTYLKTL